MLTWGINLTKKPAMSWRVIEIYLTQAIPSKSWISLYIIFRSSFSDGNKHIICKWLQFPTLMNSQAGFMVQHTWESLDDKNMAFNVFFSLWFNARTTGRFIEIFTTFLIYYHIYLVNLTWLQFESSIKWIWSISYCLAVSKLISTQSMSVAETKKQTWILETHTQLFFQLYVFISRPPGTSHAR